jgi:hypothetical protein
MLKSEVEKVHEVPEHCNAMGTSFFTINPAEEQDLEFPVCTLIEQSLMNAD